MMRKKKTRLLMGIPHPGAKGGPPTHVPILVDYFRENSDYEVKTFYYGSKSFGTERGHNETKLKKLFVTSGKLVEYLYLLGTFRPHVIHFSTAFTNLAILRDFPFAVASRIFGKKSIFKLHGSHLDLIHSDNRLQRLIVRLFFWGATRIGVLSETEEREIVQRFGHGDKFVMTKNVVTSGKPVSQTDLFEKKGHETYGLFVSRVEERKGLQDLIQAMLTIQKEVPSFRLIVAGDGPDLKKCVDLANRLGLDESIIWLGYVDNLAVQSLYLQSDVFVFPTHYPEGMPMVLVEALKSGIPIVTTKVWFGLSYLENGKNCLFVERSNPDNIALSILRLLRDNDLRFTMRKENPLLVQKFGKISVGREFEEIYERMLKDA